MIQLLLLLGKFGDFEGKLYCHVTRKRGNESTRHFRVEISAGPSIRNKEKRDCQNRTCPITVTSCWN